MQKSGTIFTTRALKGLSEEHNELTQQYEKQQRSLVKEVVAIAGGSHGTPRRQYKVLIPLEYLSIIHSYTGDLRCASGITGCDRQVGPKYRTERESAIRGLIVF